MTNLLIILLFLFGCSNTESENVAGCMNENACNYNPNSNSDDNSCNYENQCDLCYNNNDDFSCLFGDWIDSNQSAYYTIDDQSFIFRSAFTCSGIIGDLNIIEFSDTCLSTNYSFELANSLYSFKLIPNNENSIVVNFTSLENCLVDTLTRMESEIPCDD